MYNVSNSKDPVRINARLTPQKVSKDGVHFDPKAFPKWLDTCGRDYLKIDSTSQEGQKALVNANNFELDDDYWERPIDVTYMDLFWKVQMKGVKDGWSCAAEEGMHRYTSTLSLFLCGFPNSNTGYLTLASIKESDFTDLGIGRSTKISANKFQEKWVQRVFTNTKHDNLPLAVRFYSEPDMDAGYIAWTSRSYSQCQMVGKKESCNRSPFDIIGDLMGGDVKLMSIDQASRRANFSEYMSPTYNPSETLGTINANLLSNGFDPKIAYPWTELYEKPAFQAFIKNPLDKDCQNEVKSSVLSFNCMPKHYHMLIGNGEKEMQKLDKNSEEALPKLTPPFLPSFLSLAKDVGKNFEKDSLLNPDVVNGAYYGPIIITFLYAMYNNLLVHKVLENDERINIIKFFLRFVNNANEKNTMMNVHGTWKSLLGKHPINYFYECKGVEMIISCTQVVMGFFNSLLSTEMEKVADKPWDERRNMLNSIGTRFSALMERIGQQVVGVTAQTQLKVLGKCMLSCVIIVQYQPPNLHNLNVP